MRFVRPVTGVENDLKNEYEACDKNEGEGKTENESLDERLGIIIMMRGRV